MAWYNPIDSISSAWSHGRDALTGALGGISDTLFGEPPSVSNMGTLTPEQNSLLQQLIGVVSPQIGQGVSPYSGDMTAGPSSIQQQVFNTIPGLLGGDNTANKAMETFLSKYRGGYTQKKFDPTSTLNLFQSSVYDPAMKSFKEETLPQIAELFAGRGSFDSGGTMFSMNESAEDLMGSLMGTKASMLDSAKNAWDNMELQKFLGINSLLPGMAQTATNNKLSALPYAMQAGSTQQGLSQADIDAMISKWTTSQGYNNPYLNLLSTALGTQAITPVVSGGQTGLLNAMAPGLGMALGAYLAS